MRRGGNLLLLDEPTNDLDVDTLRALEEALLAFPGCAVIVSHDRWFLDRVCTHVLAFDTQMAHTRLEVVATSLVEVEAPDPGPVGQVGWDDLLDPKVRDAHVEWLAPRPVTRLGAALLEDSRGLAAGLPPHGTRLAILDDAGNPVPVGATGRIFVANDMLFDGYTNGAGKEVRDGLMSTGDLGYRDRDGLLFVAGRDDEMIVSGGENVYPREVEDLLAGLAGAQLTPGSDATALIAIMTASALASVLALALVRQR